MSSLSISNLHISVKKQEIIRGINLEVPQGEVHALMGPNGSGKSTLVNVLMGHPAYSITKGEVLFNGKDLLKMEPHERACAGLFLAFQYPKEICGVSMRSFLFAAYTAQQTVRFPDKRKISPITFQALLQQKMDILGLDHSFSERSVNEGFSGGEKKKLEVLQMLVLEPLFALLDETDSGLDIDALKVVCEGINLMRSD
ncbi:Fe-S cluster assembly ATPase SufC, partial [Patescibacteria group bacterium]|nr:Fe-S cluster assembly ATPase SufC [Patescibacteria group bacterium]